MGKHLNFYQVLDLLDNYKTSEAAARLGISLNALQHFCSRNGISSLRLKRYQDLIEEDLESGRSIRQIAKEYKMSTKSVERFCSLYIQTKTTIKAEVQK